MNATSIFKIGKLSPEKIFMMSGLLVNAGNYAYNLVLGRVLGPEQFADAAILITFLLVISFVAMSFQLVTTKFSASWDSDVYRGFVSKISNMSFIAGSILGGTIIYFSETLQELLHTTSSDMFILFGIGVPFYFLMSVNRGVFQGKKDFRSLSITYQTEMLSRLLATFLLLAFLDINSSVLIAMGILVSFLIGLYPFKKEVWNTEGYFRLSNAQQRQVFVFFCLTALYEFTQILINNSDILLVKHYFDSYEAGLYASLALIGRMVYFIAWMYVMILLPTVVKLRKEGVATAPVLRKYVGYIILVSSAIVFICFVFPKGIVRLLFGSQYIAIASLLWKYALATSLFAISNIYAYYYLSLDRYFPVVLLAIFGAAQVYLIVLFHSSLEQVVEVQILVMSALLALQFLYFLIATKNGQKA